MKSGQKTIRNYGYSENHNDRLMLALSVGHSGKAIQTIGENKTSRADVLCGPRRDFVQGKANEIAQFQEKRVNLSERDKVATNGILPDAPRLELLFRIKEDTENITKNSPLHRWRDAWIQN